MPITEMLVETKETLAEITAILKPAPDQVIDVESAYTSGMHTTLKLTRVLLAICEQQQAEIDKQHKDMTRLMQIMNKHLESTQQLTENMNKIMDRQDQVTENVKNLTQQTNSLTDQINSVVSQLRTQG